MRTNERRVSIVLFYSELYCTTYVFASISVIINEPSFDFHQRGKKRELVYIYIYITFV